MRRLPFVVTVNGEECNCSLERDERLRGRVVEALDTGRSVFEGCDEVVVPKIGHLHDLTHSTRPCAGGGWAFLI